MTAFTTYFPTASFADATGGTPRTETARINDVFNVKNFGAVGNGIADDYAPIQAAINARGSNYRGKIVFPPGTYQVNTPLVAPCSGEGSTVFEGCGFASKLIGTIADDFILTLGSSGGGSGGHVVQNLWIVNNGRHATNSIGGALQFKAIAGASVRDCKLQGQVGWACYNETYSCQASNTFFVGYGANTSDAGSSPHIGAMIGQHTSIFGGDVTACDEGIRMYGTDIAVIGVRYETNNFGIIMGKDNTGATIQAQGAIIAGGSMERNQFGIYVLSQSASQIGPITISGHPTDYDLITGLHIQGGNSLLVQGVSISGRYVDGGSGGGYGIDCTGANDVTFIEVGASNNADGSRNWNLAGNAGQIECIQSNNPSLATTVANLTASPREGAFKTVTNCTVALSPGATVTSTGSTGRALIRRDNGAWRLVCYLTWP